MITQEEREQVLEYRGLGMSYMHIESLMGWPDTHGSRVHAIVNGKKKSGNSSGRFFAMKKAKEEFDPPTARVSLWKSLDGGRSRKKIHGLLEENGIYCEAPEAGDLSPFEGRYDVLVYEEDLAKVEELLMRQVGCFEIQRLDSISDRTI